MLTAGTSELISCVLVLVLLSEVSNHQTGGNVEARSISCSQLFCGSAEEEESEEEDESEEHLPQDCNVIDECYCTTNMNMTCPKLSSVPFLMTYSSFSRELELSCKYMRKDFDTVATYIFKFLDVLHVFSITLTWCCSKEVPEDIISGLGIVDTSVSQNSLSTLNASHLRKASQVYRLSLSRNCLRNISTKFPSKLINLQELDLSANMLQEIPHNSFSELVYLELLKLDMNEIGTLWQSSFHGLRSLTSLSLASNKLEYLSMEVFQDLLNVEFLDLSNNYLKDLPSTIFIKNVQLRQLILTSNLIKTVEASSFRSLTKLLELQLSSNKLEVLPDDLFHGLTKLQKVDISNNRLKVVSPNTFRTNRDLSSVNLNGNYFGYSSGLPEIKLGAFTDLGPARFNLANNNISTLDVPLTSRVKIASKLDLSDNCVTGFHYRYTSKRYTVHGSGITEFVCRNCCLQTFHNEDIFHGILGTANLSRNEVQLVDMKLLSSIAHLDTVDLSSNRITRIQINWSYPLIQDSNKILAGNSVTKVILRNNPIICDCHILPLLKLIANESVPPDDVQRSAFRFDVVDVFCAEPSGPLQGRRINHILQVKYFLDYLVCNETSGCPRECNCYFKAIERTFVVNCSQRGLAEFPNISKTDYPILLHLEDNLIRNLPNKYSYVWPLIRELHINKNRLASFENFTLTTNLTTLNLQNNLLTKFEAPLLAILQSHANIALSLSGNPWACNCELHKLKPLLFTEGNVEDDSRITCIFPHSGKVAALSNATDDELCPELHENLFLLKVLLPTFSLLTVLVSLTVSLIFRYKLEIQLWLFTHGYCLRFVTEDDVDSKKLFDAFVSYSTKDEIWVALNLVSGLENGVPAYKLCLHNRDWQVGEWIPDQILRSVEYSRRTIIVLTDNFVDSDWSRLEFQAAYRQALSDHVNRILVVIPFNVPDSNKLGTELAAFVKLNIHIKWDDPYFWRKLRCAMPRVRPQNRACNNRLNYELGRYFVIKNEYTESIEQHTV